MSSNLSRSLKLNNGLQIPQIGLGVYKADNKECYEICKSALASGWRHIDSAAAYQNEEDVGRAVRESGVSRIELFITTKIFIHEEERAEKLDSIAEVVAAKIDSCLSKLDLGYIDLLLIHAPWRQGAWPVMESYVTSGKIKSIGVSNFGAQHIEELIKTCKIKPVVNQIELHPFLQQHETVAACKAHDIILEAYSPIVKARKLADPTVMEVAKAMGKTPAQVLIAWGVQKGYVTLPKTVTPARLEPNADVCFVIPDEEMSQLDSLDCYLTTGWDPTKYHSFELTFF